MQGVDYQKEINDLEAEIKALEAKRTEYQNMNKKINDAIKEMKSGKNEAVAAYEALKKYFDVPTKSKEELNFRDAGTEIQNKINQMNNVVASSNDVITSINTKISNRTADINEYKRLLNQAQKTTSSSSSSSSSSSNYGGSSSSPSGSSAGSSSGEYYPAPSFTGIYDSNSIVDGLKVIGVDSSYENRKKIAEVNGISNYTSSADQNIELLNKLKKGKLKI